LSGICEAKKNYEYVLQSRIEKPGNQIDTQPNIVVRRSLQLECLNITPAQWLLAWKGIQYMNTRQRYEIPMANHACIEDITVQWVWNESDAAMVSMVSGI